MTATENEEIQPPEEPGPPRSAARRALAIPAFRRVWLGALASNAGTWMQNAVLGAFGWELTQSPTYVGLLVAVQLGPMLFLAIVGGWLADRLDRRRLVLALSAQQSLAAVLIALAAAGRSPGWLLAAVAFMGIGSALYMPTWISLVPDLVPRQDLAGAISLNSTQMNASRVVGPAIGGVLYASFGAPLVFGLNAVTYVFIVWAVWSVHLPRRVPDPDARGLRHLLGGFAIARRDPLVGRILLLLPLFSLLCLPFIAQLPTVAAENLALAPRSSAYGLLYATFGLGCVAGALSVGTWLSARAPTVLARAGLGGFALALGGLALIRGPGPAFGVIFVVGFMYFMFVTTLSTSLQQHIDSSVRGRVMALWQMGFGGTVPIAGLLAGPFVEATSATALLVVGAVAAVGLFVFADLDGARRRAEGAPGVRPAGT